MHQGKLLRSRLGGVVPRASIWLTLAALSSCTQVGTGSDTPAAATPESRSVVHVLIRREGDVRRAIEAIDLPGCTVLRIRTPELAAEVVLDALEIELQRDVDDPLLYVSERPADVLGSAATIEMIFMRSPVLVAECRFLQVWLYDSIFWSAGVPVGWDGGNTYRCFAPRVFLPTALNALRQYR